jgi:hypothetical protein
MTLSKRSHAAAEGNDRVTQPGLATMLERSVAVLVVEVLMLSTS